MPTFYPIGVRDEALRLQQEKGGTAGAEYLFGAGGLHPVYWGISKQQLKDFGDEAREAIRKGEIRGNPDRRDKYYYPQERFDDPAIGPNIHQVNQGFIKPFT